MYISRRAHAANRISKRIREPQVAIGAKSNPVGAAPIREGESCHDAISCDPAYLSSLGEP